MLSRIIVFSLISLLNLQLYSQTPSYYHYTSSDGLASSTVYDLIQDRNGFIWFATSNGMSKFDGKHFTTFRTNDGLNSNSIISLAEGTKGEIYIGNYEKGINVLRNGRIENYCSTIGGKNFATSYLLLDTSEKQGQKLYAYRTWGQISVFHEKITTGRSDYSLFTNQYIVKLEKKTNAKKIVALTTKGLFEFCGDTLKKMVVTGLPDSVFYCIAQGYNDTYLLGSRKMIYRINNNSVFQKYNINIAGNNDVLSILLDKNENIWFSIMNRGFFLIPKGSEHIIDIGSKMGLQNTLVNNYLLDNEGNIWITTFGKGVYCLNNLYLKTYNENDGLSNNNVYSIVQEKTGKLIIGTFNGVNILDDDKFYPVMSNSGKTITENINSITNFNNELYVCGAFGGSDIFNVSHKGVKLHLLVSSAFGMSTTGYYMFGNWDNSIEIHKEFNFENNKSFRSYLFGDSTNINRINNIFEDSDKNIWVGTGLGLCRLSNLDSIKGIKELRKSFFPTYPILNAKINSIFQDENKTVWFAGDKGIACYNLKNDSIKVFTNIKGYDLSSSTSIVDDNKKRIWVGNMKGLFLIDGNLIQHLNSQTGLPSNEVFSLFYDKKNNQLYIGTSNGFSILDVKLFDSDVIHPPNVEILSLIAGDSIYSDYNNLVFKPKQNHVYINFKALSYSSPGSVKYKYDLNGEQDETTYDFLDLVSLKAGKYKLQIIAKTQNSEWGKPTNLMFEVEPRYYETIWFKLGRALLVVLISITLVTWRLKLKTSKMKKELELTERINDLKHQALSAMMNPHFIFNALNSVQYLINCQRNEEANDYIAMMAKLVRKNLDTAGSGFILLSDEISRLKLYLALEKLRFQENFTFEIITATNVDVNQTMIPNMIIQPFVENTLWHGIINSGSKGLVTISFSFEEVDIDSILCTSLIIKVTDNGIGLKEAGKHKKDDHISKGIQIIEERLKLLSAKLELPKPIIIEDLNDRNNTSHGTEVIISLPPQLYKIISIP